MRAGDVIEGTGGARKLRFAGKGKGKRGGFRVITFFSGADIRYSCSISSPKTRKPICSRESGAS